MKSVIEIRGLAKSYGKVQALRNVTLSFGEGIYALLGPNGSGKSTLMNILAGILKPSSGTVSYKGEDILRLGDAYRENIGYMPQYPAMYRSFTVMEFMLYMAELKGWAKSGTEQIQSILERVELLELADRRISALSGGMRQRLSLAQAILGDPRILILDEPTAGLDPRQRVIVREFISEISREKTVLWATHIVSDVESIAKEVVFMKKGVASVMEQEEGCDLEASYLSHFGDGL